MAQSIGLGSHFLHGHLGSKEQRCMQLPLPMGRFSSNILKLNRDRYVVRRRICAVCEGTAGFLGVANAPIEVSSDNAGGSSLVVDLVSEALLKENGLINTRRTKLVCTIGPASSSFEQLDRLAVGGMNVARINMCHNTREWHRDVIRNIKKLNEEKGYCIAVMMDTEGSQMHMADLGGVSSAKAEDGSTWVFTLQKFNGLRAQTIQVNYDDLVEDIMTGDEVIVDGGMARFEVVEKVGSDLHCRCTDPGLLLPRAKLTFWRNGELVGRNVVHPTLSTKDWIDIDFAISEGVDFIAVSFVKTADVIMHLKSYVASRSTEPVRVLAKIESLESLEHLEDIIQTSDGVMVARGDLGAQIPLEQIPSVQEEVVNVCRQLNKPVIIASQLLESMIEYPTPTRAEVADVSEAVRQYADALMLSGESAMGLYSEKALSILRTASLRMEQWCREENRNTFISLPELGTSMYNRISEQICNCAVEMANKLGVHAIFVYTKQGYMASLLSRNRPNSPIFAFTDSKSIRQQLNLCWGLVPFGLDFSDDMENNICNTFSLLKDRGMMKSGDLVLVVLDIPPPIQINIAESVQVRQIT